MKTVRQNPYGRGLIAVSDEEFIAAFWSRVDQGEPDVCWPWLGGRSRNGYGTVTRKRRQYGTHRLAWSFANEREIPPGMFVCHQCDNPPCCNPAHLWLGTCSDNLFDAAKKGRNILQRDPSRAPVLVKPSCRSRGERNGMAKLTDADVRLIRGLRAQGLKYREIAARVGISPNYVGDIVLGKKWRHIA